MSYVLVRADNAIWHEQYNTYAVARQEADRRNQRSHLEYDVYHLVRVTPPTHREESEVDDGRFAYE